MCHWLIVSTQYKPLNIRTFSFVFESTGRRLDVLSLNRMALMPNNQYPLRRIVDVSIDSST